MDIDQHVPILVHERFACMVLPRAPRASPFLLAAHHVTLSVYFHRDAEAEAAACSTDAASVAAALRHAIDRGLERTAGSRLKRLRHLGTHTEKRLRTGKVRSVFSLVRSELPQGEMRAYVHAVSPRNEAYSRDHFHARIDRFHRETWDVRAGAPRNENGSGVYGTVGSLATVPVDEEAELEPYLTQRQYEYFRCLLPLGAGSAERNPFLITGEGPPGSGKTLVAQEVMLRALEEDNDVLVLVPSSGLFDEYHALLQASGCPTGTLSDASDEEARVYLHDVRDFFAQLAGDSARGGDRRERVRRWWTACRADVVVSEVVRKTVGQRSDEWHRRFADLLDALYGDRVWHAGRKAATGPRKDDVEEVNEDAYRLLGALRANARAEAALDASLLRDEEGRRIPCLRCELAERAEHALDRIKLTARPLMVVADECQDLIPAEWRALLRWCYARRARAADSESRYQTRIALVGDLNQRVAVTPFIWTEVTAYASNVLKVPRELIVSERIETTSLRFAQEVGLVAKAVLDSRVTRRGKNRVAPTADVAGLLARGQVQVLVADDAWDVTVAVGADLARGLGGERQLCIIGGDEERVRRARAVEPDSLVYSARSAKGLEFPAVVVVHPVGLPGDPSGLLSPEQAMALYTAVTRARERLLCIVSPTEWACLSRARTDWSEAGVTEPLSAVGDVRAVLRDVLPGFTQHVSAAQRKELAVIRLRTLRSGPDADETEWLTDVLEEANRLLRLGAIEELAIEGAALTLEWESLANELLQRLSKPSEQAATNWDERLAAAIMLGEFAAAVKLGERAARDGCARSCDVEMLQVLEHESAWQTIVRHAGKAPAGTFRASCEVVRATAERSLAQRVRDVRARVVSGVGS